MIIKKKQMKQINAFFKTEVIVKSIFISFFIN